MHSLTARELSAAELLTRSLKSLILSIALLRSLISPKECLHASVLEQTIQTRQYSVVEPHIREELAIWNAINVACLVFDL